MTELETITEAIDLLSSVPAKDFCVGTFGNPEERKCCTIGHYVRLKSEDLTDYSHNNCSDFVSGNTKLRDVSEQYIAETSYSEYEDLADLNNGFGRWTGSESIKEHVLNCLGEIKEILEGQD